MAAAPTDNVALAYEAVDKLEQGGEVNESYLFLIDNVKVEGVQQLAAQHIPKHFAKFPDLQERAIDAQIDLCEDDNVVIRCHAIGGIAVLCRNAPKCVPRMAAVLAQLLDSDGIELRTVNRSLQVLLELDLNSTLSSVFDQAMSEDPAARKRALSTLHALVTAGKAHAAIVKDASLQAGLGQRIVELVKAIAVEEEDMTTILAMCETLPLLRKPAFHQQLYDALGELCQTAAVDTPSVEKLAKLLTVATPLVANKKAKIGLPLVNLLAEILPAMPTLPEEAVFSVLKHFALAAGSLSGDLADSLLEPVVQALHTVVVNPEQESADAAPAAPKINYSFAECLLFIFHGCGATKAARTAAFCEAAAESSIRPILDTLVQSCRTSGGKLQASLRSGSKAKDPSRLQLVQTKLKVVRSIERLASALVRRKPAFLTMKNVPPSWSKGAKAGGLSRPAGTASMMRAALASSATAPSRQRKRAFGSIHASATETKEEAAPAPARAPAEERRWKKGTGTAWRNTASKKRKTETVVGATISQEEIEERIQRAHTIAAEEKAKAKEASARRSNRYQPPAARKSGNAAAAAATSAATSARKGRGSFKYKGSMKSASSMKSARSDMRRF